jgi:hypothetical protein
LNARSATLATMPTAGPSPALARCRIIMDSD